MNTTFNEEMAKLPPEVQALVVSNQEAVSSIIGLFQTLPTITPSLLGFELMAQGYAMMTGETEAHARDVMADGFAQALQQAAAQLSHKPGNA